VKTLLLTLSLILFHLVGLPDSKNDTDLVFIIVEKNTKPNSYLYYHEIKDVTYGFRITFDIPNYSASMIHTPVRTNHPEYKHEEIEITQQELLKSKVLFADKLKFREWEDLEVFDQEGEIYMIFQEDYMTSDRFVLNHKFKALEVRVVANGPI
jgi:hypothetical protein